MKNYAMISICVLLGVMSSALVADSLTLNSYLHSGPCPDNFTGMVPNPSDCHSFYICDAGIPGLFQCPAGLCFNSQNEACDHCELVPGCESVTALPSTSSPSPSSSTEQSSTTTTQPPNSSSSPPDTTTTQPPNSSSLPPDTTTTQGTTTQGTTTTTQRTTTPSGEELSCPTDVPYIYMPYPGDCNRFYYCQDGVSTGVYNCGEGLWFHFDQQVCSLPWSSTCEARK